MTLIHGTCVAVAGQGVLIRGAPGMGKSDLALRLMDAGADLVADDYGHMRVEGGTLVLTPPAETAGKMEVRGLGLLRLPHRASVTVDLVVDLARDQDIARLPEITTTTIDGVTVPWISIDARAPSAAAKVRMALRALRENRRLAP